MTKSDLKKLKFATIRWLMMPSSVTQNAYMLGFLECKRQIEILLKEKNEPKM